MDIVFYFLTTQELNFFYLHGILITNYITNFKKDM
jgi:hypothetical protein